MMASVVSLGAGPTLLRPRVLRSIAPETNRDAALEEAIRQEVGSDGLSYKYNLVNLNDGRVPAALVYMTTPENPTMPPATPLRLRVTGDAYLAPTGLQTRNCRSSSESSIVEAE